MTGITVIVIDRRTLEPALYVLTMVLMAAALLLMGAGYGLHLSLMGLCVCLAGSSRSTIGAFCLLFGSPVLGYVFAEYVYAGWGGDVIVAIGLVLLYSRYPLQKAIAECKDGIYLLFWCFFVLLFFYLYGPRNSYAVSLMISFVKMCFLSFVAFFFIFRDRSVDWQRLGLLGIFSGLIYLAVAGRIDPGILPTSVLDIGRVRLAEPGESNLFTHLLVFLPVLGFMFIYSKDATKPKTRKDLTILIISLFTTMILVGWSGARQGLFFLLIGMSSIFMCKLEGKFRRYLLPAIAGSLLLVVIVRIGVSQDFSIYAGMVDSDKTLYEKLNRKTNFDAALWLFKQKPLLGHGLGGYYIIGHSEAGDRVFAHSVLLGLLSQTGLIGTVAFFSPLFIFRAFRRRVRMLVSLANENAVLPLFCVFFLRAMVDTDIDFVGWLIGLIGALDVILWTKSGFTTRFVRHCPAGKVSEAKNTGTLVCTGRSTGKWL